MSASPAEAAGADPETIREIRIAARELAARFPDPYWAKMDAEAEFPWEFYEAFASAGWLGVAIPARYGGAGLGIRAAADEALREELLPAAADGSLHACFAVTEPDAGTDTTRITTFARRDGSDYVISGRKVWITKAAQSQKAVLLARTAPWREDRPTEGLSMFVVDLAGSSVEMRAIPKMGRNAVSSYELFIDDLRVPASALIGEEGRGFAYLLDGINPERILLAHEALGIGRVALRRAVKYAGERVVFGRPIGANQGVAFPLAECATRLDAADAAVQTHGPGLTDDLLARELSCQAIVSRS
jgi:acyl-CoA dehydrogenase